MPQVGFKLAHYARRDHAELSSILHAVATQGFVGAETGNLFRVEGDEQQVRQLFSASGLALCGLRAGFAEFTDPEMLAENLRFVQSLGSRYLLCSGVGDRARGLAAYRDAARLFNEVGKRCRDAGLLFCYRHHAAEFADREGSTCGMDVLDHDTDPALVKYCVDVPCLIQAEVEPVQFINAHRERAAYFHFAARRRDPGADTDAVYLAAVALNPDWLVYAAAHPADPRD
jgi:sugar phosphate isomerase/epimerase